MGCTLTIVQIENQIEWRIKEIEVADQKEIMNCNTLKFGESQLEGSNAQ